MMEWAGREANLQKPKTQDKCQDLRAMDVEAGQSEGPVVWAICLKCPLMSKTIFRDQQEYHVVVGEPGFKCSGRDRQFACSNSSLKPSGLNSRVPGTLTWCSRSSKIRSDLSFLTLHSLFFCCSSNSFHLLVFAWNAFLPPFLCTNSIHF